MLASFARTTIEVLVAPKVSDHGRLVPDWTQVPTVTTITGCSWQPGPGVNDRQNRDGASVAGTVFLPAGQTVPHDAHVRIGGEEYAILGLPESWNTGLSLDHAAIRLERWRG